MTPSETLSEAMKTVDPTTDTRTPFHREIGPTVGRDSGGSGGTPCPHCGSTAKHTDRIGCCSGCKRLFTSMSAFDAHRRVTYCLDPGAAGLERKTIKSDPSVPAWGFPKGDVEWTRN